MGLLVGVGLLVIGCDSGGSNGSSGPELNGDITVRLESSGSSDVSAKASGTLTATFYHNLNDGSTCTDDDVASVSSTPTEVTLDPTDFGTCDNPSDYDGVTVSFTPSGSASGLTMTVLDGNGNEIASDTDPSDGLGVDAGQLPGSGEDTGGDDGSTNTYDFTGKWEVTKLNGEDVPSNSFFFSITTETVTIIESDGSSSYSCDVETITNIDGNTITTEPQQGGETSDVNVEVSNNGDTLALEGLDTNSVTAMRVNSVPDCP